MDATTLCLCGPPRSGKSTVLERAATRLEERGLAVAGVVCPERRRDGNRVGFDVVDRATGERAVLASVDLEGPPRVGRYGVDVDALETVAVSALRRSSDCVIIDELAPMQLESDAFVDAARSCIAAPTPVVATVKSGYHEGLAGTVQDRSAVRTVQVTPDTRDSLPDRVTSWVSDRTR